MDRIKFKLSPKGSVFKGGMLDVGVLLFPFRVLITSEIGRRRVKDAK